VTRRPDRQVAEPKVPGGPGAERQFPGQIQQPGASIAQPELRKTRSGDGREVRQSFLRR
jgi:hypothetical protein